ncbi:MAG: D-aminoacyl-tRNA deacylase [Halanaeroarchaeum sp.]
MIGIVVSRADSASAAIGEHLLAARDWTEVEPDVHRTEGFELRHYDEWHLHLTDVASEFADPDSLVFASRHSGETGKLLSAHFTGNFGAAELGGEDRDLATPCPVAHKRVIRTLDDNAPEGWDVAMECTHHGPTTVGAPSMFVELGSSESEWGDPAGAEAVAQAILALGEEQPGAETTDETRTVVGFGGNHYAPRPTRLLLETDVAFGHVAADWSLEDLGLPAAHEDVIDEMFERSGAECALFDGEHPAVEEVIEDLGYRVVSETWLRETDGRPMELVESVEDRLSTVAAGLRFGEATADPEDLLVVDIDDDLLRACHAADLDGTVAAVAAHAVAYETEENGNRVAGAAAFPDGAAYEAFLDDAVEMLSAEYDRVSRSDGVIEAERSTFDPALAHEAGVPEGPKFGTLAAGEPVTVDGETVEPADVETEEIRRFRV